MQSGNVQAIFHDGTVGLEFMTSRAEAEETREQWPALDCVAEMRILDEPGRFEV